MGQKPSGLSLSCLRMIWQRKEASTATQNLPSLQTDFDDQEGDSKAIGKLLLIQELNSVITGIRGARSRSEPQCE